MPVLSRLIGKHNIEEFFSTYWGKAPFFNECNAEKTLDTVGIDDIYELLGRQVLPDDALILMDKGKQVPNSHFCHQRSYNDKERLDVSRVQDSIEGKGLSLLIKRAHCWFPSLNITVNDIKQQLGLDTGINLYYSPPGGSGLEPHYDRHDVIVVQLSGNKDWRLLDDDNTINFPSRPSSDLSTPEKTLLEVTLRDKNVLYLPAGAWHHAVAGKSGSLHASIGIQPFTMADLLRDTIEHIQTQSIFIQRLPLPTGYQDHELKALFQDIREQLNKELTDDKFKQQLVYMTEKIRHA